MRRHYRVRRIMWRHYNVGRHDHLRRHYHGRRYYHGRHIRGAVADAVTILAVEAQSAKARTNVILGDECCAVAAKPGSFGVERE